MITRSNALFGLFALTCATGTTAQAVEEPSGAAAKLPYAPLPTFSQLAIGVDTPSVDAQGDLEWIGMRFDLPIRAGCSDAQMTHERWDPRTGTIQTQLLTQKDLPGASHQLRGGADAQVQLSGGGLLWLSVSGCDPNQQVGFGLLLKDGRVFTIRTDDNLKILGARMVPLSATSAALITRDATTHHIVVHAVGLEGAELKDERMPDLPIAFNNDFAQAPLGKDRLMILGGSNCSYRGCKEAWAETHILDLQKKTWSNGPSMLEGRTEHAATALPDGSVLVTGGWTQAAPWSYEGPSRTTERWNPATNAFERAPPMPVGDVQHRGMWLPGNEGKILLMVDGDSASVPAYDIAANTWRIAGTWPQSSKDGAHLYPFVAGDQAYAWMFQSGSLSSGTSSVYFTNLYPSGGTIGLLRPSAETTSASTPPDPSFLATNRVGFAFVPASGDLPARVIGGSNRALDSFQVSAAVDAIDTDGRIRSMPSLIDPQTETTALRMQGGVLVFNGKDGRQRPSIPPMEWSAQPGARHPGAWQYVEGVSPGESSAVCELANGDLLEVDDQGGLTEIHLAMIQGKLTLQRSAFPVPGPAHQSTEQAHAQVRQLADGRIVIAGGAAQTGSIALQTDDSNDPHAVDSYQGVGSFAPARTYATFDPHSQRWSVSAASSIDTRVVAILGDGRVMQLDLGSVEQPLQRPRQIEISSADGTRWTQLPPAAFPQTNLQRDYKLIVADGELFICGDVASAPGTSVWGVDWFDPAKMAWTTLASGPANNGVLGAFHVIRLTNGKVVVLPGASE
jgi:hypothetical protein